MEILGHPTKKKLFFVNFVEFIDEKPCNYYFLFVFRCANINLCAESSLSANTTKFNFFNFPA